MKFTLLNICHYYYYDYQETLPDLHQHFLAHAFHTSMYSSSWFLTLFTTSLPLPLVCRIFDIFLNEGFEIIFRVGLALLEFHKDYLMLLDMEGMLKVILSFLRYKYIQQQKVSISNFSTFANILQFNYKYRFQYFGFTYI